MKTIPLTQGKVAIVDDEDYDRLCQFKWHALKRKRGLAWYAARGGPRSPGDRNSGRLIYMHRVIVGAAEGEMVDHKDRDGLNNRRENLRPASRLDNARNAIKVRIKKTSRFRGVSFYKKTKRWKAQINLKSGKKSIGYFTDERAAAEAYDAVALANFGEFAVLNFPQEVKP